MSERPVSEPLRPPAESRLRAGLKVGVLGLALGLFGAGLFIIPQQSRANAVNLVFSEARAVVLTARVDRGAWPPDAELSALPVGARGPRLRTLLAECPLPGGWRFVNGRGAGGPAIVFTPAEPGPAYERCLRLVDAWLDDGDPATGDLVVGSDRARLRLSAE